MTTTPDTIRREIEAADAAIRRVCAHAYASMGQPDAIVDGARRAHGEHLYRLYLDLGRAEADPSAVALDTMRREKAAKGQG